MVCRILMVLVSIKAMDIEGIAERAGLSLSG
jgi:hypothetical protein